MATAGTSCVERPKVAFRVGVSGAVDFDPAQVDRVRDEVATVLRCILEEVLRAAKTAAASRVYDAAPPQLWVVSPLADGADRVVAEEALKIGFLLQVVLPFERTQYESTFAAKNPERRPASVTGFEKLLAAASGRVLILDGDRTDDTDRHRSYEAVGRLVVRNCDLLIAIWDDQTPSRGRGGTADTLQYALRSGVPVWWINAAKPVPPRWLENLLDLPRLGVGHAGGGGELRRYVAKTILPPGPPEAEVGGLWDAIMRCLRSTLRIEADPLLAFLDETGLPNRKYWNLHPDMIRSLRGKGARLRAVDGVGARPAPAQPISHEPASRYGRLARAVSEPFRRNPPIRASSIAAGLSRIYQHRYRSSYMLVFCAGAVALVGAVVGLAFPETEHVAVAFELVMLLAIFFLVVCNELQRWHERYISYRMLGELLRLWRHLHGLGLGLPGTRVNNLAQSTRRNWVAWYFAAIVRATPLQTGDLGAGLAETKLAIVENLIGEQIDFHRRRHIECQGAAAILAGWGRGLFLVTLALVVLRVFLVFEHAGEVTSRILSLSCALLPAFSAAIFGVRAYEEFEVLAEQSEQMQEALNRARERIERIAVDRPLASQVLGTELFDVATIMLSDVAGWAQLFRMKIVEA